MPPFATGYVLRDVVRDDTSLLKKVPVCAHVAKLMHLDKMSTLVQRSDAWYEARKTSITASQVAAILGVKGAFDTRLDVLRKKLYLTDDATFDGNAATRHGVRYEPEAIRRYENHVGRVVVPFGLLKSVNENEPFYAASPDGITQDGLLVEVKCPFSRVPTEEVPAYYLPQLQFSMHIFDIEACDFIQYVPETTWTNEVFIVTRVQRDRAWMDAARPVLEAFWNEVLRLRGKPMWELELPEDDARLDPSLRPPAKRTKHAATRLEATSTFCCDDPAVAVLGVETTRVAELRAAEAQEAQNKEPVKPSAFAEAMFAIGDDRPRQ